MADDREQRDEAQDGPASIADTAVETAVLEKLRAIWGEDSRHEQFLADLRSNLRHSDRHLSLSVLRRWSSPDAAAVDQCAMWFTTSAMPLLRLGYVLFTEDDHEHFLTGDEGARAVIERGYTIPETGERVEGDDLLRSLYPFFEPTDELRELLDAEEAGS